MFNDITEDGRIPRIWKTARVILLPKPRKDPSHPSAYRTISILPVLSKMWENILKKLIKRCIGVDLFDNNQHGFRKKHSTVDAACRLMKIADSCKNKKS